MDRILNYQFFGQVTVYIFSLQICDMDGMGNDLNCEKSNLAMSTPYYMSSEE